MGKFRLFAAGAAVFGLAFSACSDPEADHRAALDASIPSDLAFADASNAGCLSGAIEETIGLEGLNRKGLSTDALSDGTGDVAMLFRGFDSDEIDLAYRCVNADSLLVEQFNDQLSIAVEPGCIDDSVLRSEPFARTVLASEDISVNNDLRDVVRGCVGSDDFASLFGLDQPDELADALRVEPIGIAIDDDDVRACVGTTITDIIGSERLNDAGVSVAQPDPFALTVSLTDDELQTVDSTLVDCEALTPMLMAKAIAEETQAGECAIERLNGELKLEVLNSIRDNERRWKRSPFGSALDECINEMLDERFGTEPIDPELKGFAQGYIGGATGGPDSPEPNEYEEACMERSVPLFVTEQSVDELLRTAQGEYVVLSQASWDLIASTGNCIDGIKNLRAELSAIGFSEATMECIAEDLDSDLVAVIYDASLNGPEADVSLLPSYFDAIDEVSDRIDECATDSELNKWSESVQSA